MSDDEIKCVYLSETEILTLCNQSIIMTSLAVLVPPPLSQQLMDQSTRTVQYIEKYKT